MKIIIVNCLEFFLVLSVMFLLGSFLSHIVMRRVSLEKIFARLEQKNNWLGNAIAAVIGALTPFCVCTSIPVFTAMVQMGIKTNVAISFLFASPLINFSSTILIWFLFGVKFAVYYLAMALIFSIVAGVIVSYLRWDDAVNLAPAPEGKKEALAAATFAWQLFKNLLAPLLIGAVIAGFIHNYVPVKLITAVNGYPVWLLIFLATLIGFPIYANIMVLAPVCFMLVNKGMNPGAVMAFLMAGAGISFPTAIVLQRILKPRLFFYYLGYTFAAYYIIGYIFNFI